jgi:hypothetical protein
MSNVARVAGQAANTLVKPLEVEDVFSTYLYEGNGSTQTITNGIDLDGEGGLVWIKNRDQADNHRLHDTVRGNPQNTLITNLTLAAFDQANSVTGFNSNGFDIGSYSQVNTSGEDFASWTFRKAPKFFDVVTYTGTGSVQTISHNLGSVPGMIIVKSTSNAFNWVVYHRGTDSTAPEDYITYLDLTNAKANVAGAWNDTAPTSTEFTVGTTSAVNYNGGTFVAYLFAHNDGDGDFGPDGDADIVKCGSYTGNGSAGNNVDLGFEPQWLMIKRANSTGNWQIADVMRGMPNNSGAGAYQRLSANLINAEVNGQEGPIPTSTGFVLNSTSSDTNANGGNYIYIAIRRPTAVPTSATEVFDVQTSTSANFVHTTGFDVDLAITGSQDGWARNAGVIDRLRGDAKSLETSNTDAESAGNAGVHEFDRSREYLNSSTSGDQVAWSWKRAPKYFDVVAYTGDGSKQTIAHNLGVAPEMMWIKVRSTTQHWAVYHPDLPGSGKFISLNNNWDGNSTNSTFWDGETPTSTTFSVGATGVNNNYVNGSPNTYIAYLFASLDGISKVGSVTHSGTTNVDCGFSAGSRFVLLKRTDATGDWYIWDSTRGIVSGNDPYLLLNTTGAEVTNTDLIDPLSSGFTITSSLTAGDYIFYAIA